MRADGSERHVLVAGKTVSDPAWSPDGSTLAYIKGDRVMVRRHRVLDPAQGRQRLRPHLVPGRHHDRLLALHRAQRQRLPHADHPARRRDRRRARARQPEARRALHVRERLVMVTGRDDDRLLAIAAEPEVLLRRGHPHDPRRRRRLPRADPRRALGGLVAGRPADRLRGHPRPQRQPLRLGRVQLGRGALRRQRRRQRAHAPDPQRVRGSRHRAWSPDGIPDPVQQRPERARGRLLRGLLDRARRELLHVADQRDAVERAIPPGDREAATPSTPAAAIRTRARRCSA